MTGRPRPKGLCVYCGNPVPPSGGRPWETCSEYCRDQWRRVRLRAHRQRRTLELEILAALARAEGMPGQSAVVDYLGRALRAVDRTPPRDIGYAELATGYARLAAEIDALTAAS